MAGRGGDGGAGLGGVRPGTTSTAGPTATMAAATVTRASVEEQFLAEVEQFVRRDDRLPGSAQEALVILYGQQPTFVFPENQGLVLQPYLWSCGGEDRKKPPSADGWLLDKSGSTATA